MERRVTSLLVLKHFRSLHIRQLFVVLNNFLNITRFIERSARDDRSGLIYVPSTCVRRGESVAGASENGKERLRCAFRIEPLYDLLIVISSSSRGVHCDRKGM